MYVISEGKHAILIDPFECEINNQLCVDMILLTHEHYDHISGVNYWKEKTGANVICHKKCAENISDSRNNLSKYFDTFCELQTWIKNPQHIETDEYLCYADTVYEENYHTFWKCHELSIAYWPGHSAGSSCICIDEDIVFSGDSLFENFPTDFFPPTGSKKRWKNETVPLIEKMRDDARIYPGHFDDFLFKDSFYKKMEKK